MLKRMIPEFLLKKLSMVINALIEMAGLAAGKVSFYHISSFLFK